MSSERGPAIACHRPARSRLALEFARIFFCVYKYKSILVNRLPCKTVSYARMIPEVFSYRSLPKQLDSKRTGFRSMPHAFAGVYFPFIATSSYQTPLDILNINKEPV